MALRPKLRFDDGPDTLLGLHSFQSHGRPMLHWFKTGRIKVEQRQLEKAQAGTKANRKRRKV